MKRCTMATTLALAAALGLGVSAPVRAQAVDPCSVFLCMAGVSGPDAGAPGPECTASIAAFHAIQVWSPAFNPPATATARRTYLMTCPGVVPVNQATLELIISKWGYTP
ncbi:hypothetical protein XcuCFBP2542_15055 [Xanthomonas cucurbitae]|uniref:Uncharacterized protein n=1 Tax=Xanthomonas cucurbitae TaxID=56453 RepID=A0A2S7DN82_9XANT|nr:hypothetical protein XcuCFBP2542_15055 [Xanthomonas cucurbitae]QHG87607.1 hypothetical protein EBN15_12320 [Xanthomonas cucurbitae]